MNKLTRPMTLAETRKQMDEDNLIKVVISVSLHELFDNDLEQFNDLVESRIVEKGILADISYRIVGHEPPTNEYDSGQALIEVKAEVDLGSYHDEEE